MERIVRALRARVTRTVTGEHGFTLLELALASGVLALVMSSLAYVGTVAFTDAAVARSRQTATSLANEAIEQVRALPYDTVAKGLLTSDLGTGSDPLVTDSGSGEYRYGGERIPNSTTSASPPIAPHVNVHVVDGTDYSVAVYVTYMNDDSSSRAYRITARVAWLSAVRGGGERSVETQTVLYSPGAGGTTACNSTAAHPYAAPCAPFFYGNAVAGDGGVTVSAVSSGTPAVNGLDIAEAMLELPVGSSTMLIEQVAKVDSVAKTSGVSITHTSPSTAAQTSGRSVVSAGADSDPSQPKPPYQQNSTASAQTGSTVTASGSTSSSMSLTSSGGDTATATATVTSTATNACGNAASPSVLQTDSLPCGNATAVQAGTMKQHVDIGSLGSTVIASMGPSSAVSHVNYDATPQASSCTATADDGCVSASVRQEVGPVRIGGLPSALSTVAPLGFDYLIKLDNFTRTVTAEAGVGNGNPSSTSAGTITYWNGLGYSTMAVQSSSTTATIPIPTVEVISVSESTTLSISGVMRTGATTLPACASPCTDATAESESPFVGDIRYTFVLNGSTVADFLVHVDFGSLVAHAEYVPDA